MVAAYEKQLAELRDRMRQMAEDHSAALDAQRRAIEAAAAKAQQEALERLEARLRAEFANLSAQQRAEAEREKEAALAALRRAMEDEKHQALQELEARLRAEFEARLRSVTDGYELKLTDLRDKAASAAATAALV